MGDHDGNGGGTSLKKETPPKEDLEPQMVGQYSRVVRKYGNVGWGVGK